MTNYQLLKYFQRKFRNWDFFIHSSDKYANLEIFRFFQGEPENSCEKFIVTILISDFENGNIKIHEYYEV